jgi:hypothetical protein
LMAIPAQFHASPIRSLTSILLFGVFLIGPSEPSLISFIVLRIL